MGEILGGIIFMAVFIGFILLTQRNKQKKPGDDMKRINEARYWAQRDAEKTKVVSSDADQDNQDNQDNSNDDENDNDGDGDDD